MWEAKDEQEEDIKYMNVDDDEAVVVGKVDDGK